MFNTPFRGVDSAFREDRSLRIFYGASDTAGPASVRLNQVVPGDLIGVSVKVRKQNG
jgi:hypothetical protein